MLTTSASEQALYQNMKSRLAQDSSPAAEPTSPPTQAQPSASRQDHDSANAGALPSVPKSASEQKKPTSSRLKRKQAPARRAASLEERRRETGEQREEQAEGPSHVQYAESDGGDDDGDQVSTWSDLMCCPACLPLLMAKSVTGQDHTTATTPKAITYCCISAPQSDLKPEDYHVHVTM